jgi:hypothetical protein
VLATPTINPQEFVVTVISIYHLPELFHIVARTQSHDAAEVVTKFHPLRVIHALSEGFQVAYVTTDVQ